MIRLKDVTKSYPMGSRELVVLKGVSISIEKGEIVAIMGPSGSGKSTMLNLLGCLDTPSSGTYYLEGREVMWQSIPLDRSFINPILVKKLTLA